MKNRRARRTQSETWLESLVPPAEVPSILAHFHPFNTALKMRAHLRRAIVVNAAMAGQHPLEFMVEQFLHRLNLFSPRIPARAAKRDQCVSIRRPSEVISGEEELVLIKQDG